MSIAENLTAIRATLPEGVGLVAVSKFHPAEAVMEAYAAGQRLFGESRAAELTVKKAECPADIRWHFIGHLQSNKVKAVVEAADIIESIDTLRLLERVDRAAAEAGRSLEVFLQAHVAAEETKFGFAPEEMIAWITPQVADSLRAVRITGIMGMASNTDDTCRINADFGALRNLFERMRAIIPSITYLSMGMSSDYMLAIENGSNIVRIGTDIFGPRQY